MLSVDQAVHAALRDPFADPFARVQVRSDDNGDKSDRILSLLTQLTSRMDAMEEELKHEREDARRREDSRSRRDSEHEEHEEREDSRRRRADADESRDEQRADKDEENHEMLKKLTEHMGGLHAKHDALSESVADLHDKHDALRADHEAMRKRLDAFEGKSEDEDEDDKDEMPGVTADADEQPVELKIEEDEPREDSEEHEEEGRREDSRRRRADKEEHEEREDSRRRRADADDEEEGLREEREENGLRMNDGRRREDSRSRRDSEHEEEHREDSRADALRRENRRLWARLSEVERRVPEELADKDRARFVEAQVKADRVHHAFGDSAGAPARVNGERLTQYRIRLLRRFQAHSPAWKDVDLSKIADDVALGVAEGQILSDAYNAALHPTADSSPTLRPVYEKDPSGRQITKWAGSPRAFCDQFKYSR